MAEKGYEDEQEGPVIRDRRRIDPDTGDVRESAEAGPDDRAGAPAEPPAGGDSAELEELRTQVGERTADLQRLQAEYTNYRRRVERDRVVVQELAVAKVLADLLPVLDDIGRAREHEELTGGFKSVAESLEATVTKLGLNRFGEVGDPFDPNVHEALMHKYSDEVTEPTCVEIFQPGYTMAERVIRPARVVVAEPGGDAPAAEAAPEAADAPETAPDDSGAGPQEGQEGEVWPPEGAAGGSDAAGGAEK
ncbi:nucleotide exchange factor GrpE [Allonocardiopsis opalescens]|uniref:Protein GrpE n=1 Tax=Allonocardiopsis opalescens TaxID=1144618 RepID=A0A2T0Q307_9ACTN|nr:nucleotide exchange factor GrpE [Allonocardiopsis opalescens]PRX98187.1 molecular chaperone GrpE [Allonocardiopsis opalescens]